MSLRLLIDEDYQAKYLVNLLRKSGHNVLTINDVDIAGAPDSEVFDYARTNERIIVTRNCEDFRLLHTEQPFHPGVFVVYEGSDLNKNMSYKAVVEAIANIENSGINIENQLIELNQWNY